MSVILGPLLCHVCRRRIWWYGWFWVDTTGKHSCRRRKEA